MLEIINYEWTYEESDEWLAGVNYLPKSYEMNHSDVWDRAESKNKLWRNARFL